MGSTPPPTSAARQAVDKAMCNMKPIERLELASSILIDEIARRKAKKADKGTDGLIED